MSINDENKEAIEGLIAKQLSGNITPEELEQLNQWKLASAANRDAYVEYERTWFASNQPIKVDTNAAWQKVSQRLAFDKKPTISINRKRTWVNQLAVAASFALLVSIAGFYFFNAGTTYSADGIQLAVALQDGSFIDLNAASSLQVTSSFNDKERRVELDGEAFFDIAKDKTKPFVIETDLVEVRVLGTSFNVDENEDSVVVTVATGIVEVTDISAPNNTRKLAKGERIIFRNNKKSFENLAFDENDFAWKTRTLVFRRTYLSNAFKVLEATYGVEIELSNEDIEYCQLTAQFEDQELEDVLDVIQSTFQLEIIQKGKKITITGEGCK